MNISRQDLTALVRRTIDALEGAPLPLQMPGSLELAESRRQLLTQLQTRILPHLESADLPAIIVFGGSSGAGKSTLVNSLVQAEVTEASVLRPTTRTPVFVMHPDDAPQMENHALSQMGEYAVVDTAIPGIVLVDAPDLDSVDASNRELSARLLDAADLWVFVTTASRYGDAVAWSTLQQAQLRGITCAVVLDRVPQRALQSVRADLMRRMADLELQDSPLFIVPDVGAHSGPLPAEHVAQLRSWLEMIARAKLGNSLVDRTTEATMPKLQEDLIILADAVEEQGNALVDLKDQAAEGASAPLDKLATNIAHGRFGQGAPTTAWLSLASTGGPLASLVTGRRPRPILDRSRKTRDNATTSIFEAILASVQVALTQGLTTAKANVEESWAADVVETSQLRRSAGETLDIAAITQRALVGWQRELQILAGQMSRNSWLSPEGVTSLLGVAAGGIVGAQKAARTMGGEKQVRAARESLAEQVRAAMRELVGAYANAVDQVEVGDAQTLRTRASELLEVFGEK